MYLQWNHKCSPSQSRETVPLREIRSRLEKVPVIFFQFPPVGIPPPHPIIRQTLSAPFSFNFLIHSYKYILIHCKDGNKEKTMCAHFFFTESYCPRFQEGPLSILFFYIFMYNTYMHCYAGWQESNPKCCNRSQVCYWWATQISAYIHMYVQCTYMWVYGQ